jgi:hypothetical protein
MRSRSRKCAVLALLVVSACGRDAGQPVIPPEPGEPRAPTPLGVYEIAVTGIGSGDARSSIVPEPGPRGGPAATLIPAGGGLVFEQVASSSFTEGVRGAGGQRYVSFTYRVRNGTGADLDNVTLLMVSRAGTIPGTPISSLKRFDGTDAAPALARAVVPTGAAAMHGDVVTMGAPYPDVIQAFSEAEVAAIAQPGDVTGIFPYGYVVRGADPGAATRRIPAAALANQYGGVLTVAFRVPLQASSAQDVFSIFFQVLAVEDSETRLTESIEEGQDTAAVRRLRERALEMGATSVTVLAGSTAAAADVADYPGQRQLCLVRTAGTAASPVAYVTAPGAYSRLEMLRPGEATSACGARFRSGTPAVPVVGTPYPVTVKAMDRYGNVLAGTADTVSLYRIAGASATFGPPAALVAGQATISATFTSGGTAVLGAAGRRIRGQRTIAMAPSATVVVNGGDNQAAMAGAAVAAAPSVLVRDLEGNPLPGVPVTFTVTGGGGSVTGAAAVTNASGIATAGGWVLGSPRALNTLSAFAAGAAAPVGFRASGCSGGGGPGYAVTLCYTTALTAAERAAFDSAAARWSRVITGDVPGVSLAGNVGTCGSSSPSFDLAVDDLLIFAGVEPADGPGGRMGAAGVCYIRDPNQEPYRMLPLLSQVRMDAADAAHLAATGLLNGVVLHEMGHALGIGSEWGRNNLVKLPSTAGHPGLPPVDTYYSGAGGLAGFGLIGGDAYTAGNKVPLENTGGQWTVHGHWRESVLGNELMTGYASYGAMPLSQLTVRSLADLGYTVDPSAADAFALPSGSVVPGPVPLGNDILGYPTYAVDARGPVAGPLR